METENEVKNEAVNYFNYLKEMGVDSVEPAAYNRCADEEILPNDLPNDLAKGGEELKKSRSYASGGLEKIAAQVASCKSCGLHETRTQTVFGTGSPKADIMFVGEAPGKEEDKQGKPFVGRAGQLLTKMINAINFSRDDVYIANVLKCRPPQNRDPKPEEVALCEDYLIRQIEAIKPKFICAMGLHAAHTLLRTKDSLGKLRGRFHDYHGVPLMATYHPAALLRNPGWKQAAWEDLKVLRDEHKKNA